MKEQNTLCARNERYGTLDLWINPEGQTLGDEQLHIVASFNGTPIETEQAYSLGLGNSNDEDTAKKLDWLLGLIGRDTQNYFFKDIVIHWGVHTWKFINEKNITTIEKDEYTQTMQDIEMNYDIEW